MLQVQGGVELGNGGVSQGQGMAAETDVRVPFLLSGPPGALAGIPACWEEETTSPLCRQNAVAGLFGCLRSDRLLMSAGSQAPPLVAEG